MWEFIFENNKSHSTARRGAVRFPPVCWLVLPFTAVLGKLIIELLECASLNVPTCECESARFHPGSRNITHLDLILLEGKASHHTTEQTRLTFLGFNKKEGEIQALIIRPICKRCKDFQRCGPNFGCFTKILEMGSCCWYILKETLLLYK